MKKISTALVVIMLLVGAGAFGFVADANSQEDKRSQRCVDGIIEMANQGNAEAQWCLGDMYLKGKGVRQNYQKAYEWYKKSANQGNAKAQLFLGDMYEKGKCVRKNIRIAKEWYGKACNSGNQDGCDAYKRLNEKGY